MTAPENDVTANRLGECTDAAMKEAVARDARKVEAQVADAGAKIEQAVESHMRKLDGDVTR